MLFQREQKFYINSSVVCSMSTPAKCQKIKKTKCYVNKQEIEKYNNLI